MVRCLKSWKAGFYAYMLLSSMVFGAYLVMARDLVKSELGYDFRFMTWLVAAENAPMLFSVLAGGLGDVLGRRHVLLIGALASVPLYMMGVSSLKVLPLLAALYVTLWTISSPSVTGAFLDATESSGIQYSLYAMFGSIGWGSGGLIAGFLKLVGGTHAVFIFASLAMIVASLAAYFSYPEHEVSERATMPQVFRGVRAVLPTFAVVTGIMVAITLFYGNYSLRLREIAGSTQAFALIYTALPAAAGALVRPLAGHLSDRFSPKTMLAITIIGYITLFPLMTASWGLTAVLLWLVPFYPFMDQGSMMLISRRLPRSLQAVAAGVWTTASSAAGVLVLIASQTPVVSDLWSITALSVASLLTSLLILLVLVNHISTRKNIHLRSTL